MIDNEIRAYVQQELAPLKKRLNDAERKQSGYTEQKSEEVKAIDGDNWTDKETYYEDGYVMHNNILWICLIRNKGVEPVEGSPYWSRCNIASELNRLARMIKEDK